MLNKGAAASTPRSSAVRLPPGACAHVYSNTNRTDGSVLAGTGAVARYTRHGTAMTRYRTAVPRRTLVTRTRTEHALKIAVVERSTDALGTSACAPSGHPV
jgi:hypothetical protein